MGKFTYIDLDVLYEDNHVLVCLKPPGVLSQAASLDLPDMLTVGKEYIKVKYEKPGNVFLGLVHRLDLNVGGVMVFARTSKAASRLSEAMREEAFAKYYFAVVEGLISPGETGTFTDYLSKDESSLMSVEDIFGQECILEYESLTNTTHRSTQLSLIKIKLITGRFHQIRKQFSMRGHPLYGDTKYGSQLSLNSLPLWAYMLEFPHPTTKEILSFSVKPENSSFMMFHDYLIDYLK